MALTKTQLTAAIKANDLVLAVANTTTGFPGIGVISYPQQPVLIEQEMMFLVQVTAPGTILVRGRGFDGTAAVPHDISAPVVTSAAPGDFPSITPGFWNTIPLEMPRELTYGQNGIIVAPVAPAGAVAILNGSVALVMTLAAPSLAATGVPLAILSQTAFSHTISAPGLLLTGGAGAPFSNITFPAAIGAQVDLIAQNGFWSVSSISGLITFS